MVEVMITKINVGWHPGNTTETEGAPFAGAIDLAASKYVVRDGLHGGEKISVL